MSGVEWHYCDCAWPQVRFDDESSQEICILCGGVVKADMSEGDLTDIQEELTNGIF